MVVVHTLKKKCERVVADAVVVVVVVVVVIVAIVLFLSCCRVVRFRSL